MPTKTAPPNKIHAPPIVEDAFAAAAEQVSILKRSGRILAKTAEAFFADNINRLGAALAFYTTVAIAPLLVLAVALAGTVFAEGEARQQVIGEIGRLAGSQASAAIASVQTPEASATGIFTTMLGAATLIFGSLGVFTHLQNSLNGRKLVAFPQAASLLAGHRPGHGLLAPRFADRECDAELARH